MASERRVQKARLKTPWLLILTPTKNNKKQIPRYWMLTYAERRCFELRWNSFWLWNWGTCKYQGFGLSGEQEYIPVSINKTGIDVIRSFYSSDRLQAYPCGFIWHNINKAIFEFITWKIGTDESWGVSFRAG